MKKLTKTLVKRISEFLPEIENIKCQKYNDGRCVEFLALADINTICSACQIREGVRLIKCGIDRYNPEQIVF